MAKIGTDIAYAARLLREGKLVGVPTDTVYGLAGHAQLEGALKDIFKVKGRPQTKPLIAQVDSLEKANRLIKNVPNHARVLAEKYWPGPLTLIFEARHDVLSMMCDHEQGTIGLRVPDHPMTLELLRLLDFPLAVTSANLNGQTSPANAQEVDQQLGDRIEYILDGGPSQHGLESTIVTFDKDHMPVILRKGALSIEDIYSTLHLSTIKNK